jgi:hypothetical protein
VSSSLLILTYKREPLPQSKCNWWDHPNPEETHH